MVVIGACVGLLAWGVNAANGRVRTQHVPENARGVVRQLMQRGVPCEALRRGKPSYVGELDEAHCRGYSLARFASPAERAAWYERRIREPWFPGRWIVVNARWAAWTSRADVATALAKAGHGIRRRVRLPSPVAHVTKLCDQSVYTCTIPLARPTPMTAAGYVYSFAWVAWDTAYTDTATGLRIVQSSDPGTAAITGVVQRFDTSAPRKGPIAGVRITIRTIDSRLPPRRLTTITDRWGAFAFSNIPTQADGSCYLVTASARKLITVAYDGLFSPNGRYQVTWDGPVVRDSDSDKCPYPGTLP
jgi:hypothetical protein